MTLHSKHEDYSFLKKKNQAYVECAIQIIYYYMLELFINK